jgi:formamidopyrimidine-DNA glycosylase
MPELPEVAALTEFLAGRLRGATVAKIQIVSFAVLKTADPPFSELVGRTVTDVSRFGKFISVAADGLYFVFHLARAGWVRFTDAPADVQLKMGKGYLAARLSFSSDAGALGLDLTEAGTKKSLAVYVVRDPYDVPGIAALGPDPFSPGFDVGALAGILGSSSQQIKGLLRSQSVIAGIGNAYSDEILHAARTSPFAIARSLDRMRSSGSTTPFTPSWGQPCRRPGARRPMSSRTPSAATCGSMAGRARHARSAGTPCARCRLRTRPCSTVRTARPRGRSWPTAGRRVS